jgi:hypothetical protein
MTDKLILAASQHYHWYSTLAAWGNIGNFIAGCSAVVLASAAIITGTAGLNDWRAKQRAQRALADEERLNLRLDRQRILDGWTASGLPVYRVELVTEPAEAARAQEQLTEGGPTEYVIMRVAEGGSGNENRARTLRQQIEREHFVTRPPERGEYEALDAGRQALASAWRQAAVPGES